MREFVTGRFNTMIFLGAVVGLTVPGLEYLPKFTALVLMSIAIYFSSSAITIDEFKDIRIREALVFYVVRFLLFPIPVYFAALWFVPDYSVGFLLLALAPMGVTSTVIAGVVRANTSLALSATVITNMLAPLIIPLYVYVLCGDAVNVSTVKIFVTLLIAIFLPVAIYFGFSRRVETLKGFTKRQAGFVSTLCVSGLVAVITAMQKDYIINQPEELLFLVVVSSLIFVMFYGAGYFYATGKTNKDKKTYMICSGVNNTTMAIGISALYFSPIVVITLIAAEFPWIFGVMFFKKYADKLDG